jgi:hypothetical protein
MPPFDSSLSYLAPASPANGELRILVDNVEMNIRALAFSVPWILAAFNLQHRSFTLHQFFSVKIFF